MEHAAHPVSRAFVRIDEGQVHYRTAGEDTADPPIYLLHASPASSVAMAPLVAALAPHRRAIAPDTLGNGDSPAPAPDSPDLAYLADAMDRMADALGLDRVDVYGTHTGAHIAIEWAIARPDRVRRIVLNGIAHLPGDLRAEYLANYAPKMAPDALGGQFHWAWNFIRDQMIFFPHYKKDREHLRAAGTFDPGVLHMLTMEVLKALETYHLPYEAAFRHDLEKRLPLVEQEVLCLVAESDYLALGTELARRKLRNARFETVAHDFDEEGTVAAVLDFLSRPA